MQKLLYELVFLHGLRTKLAILPIKRWIAHCQQNRQKLIDYPVIHQMKILHSVFSHNRFLEQTRNSLNTQHQKQLIHL